MALGSGPGHVWEHGNGNSVDVMDPKSVIGPINVLPTSRLTNVSTLLLIISCLTFPPVQEVGLALENISPT